MEMSRAAAMLIPPARPVGRDLPLLRVVLPLPEAPDPVDESISQPPKLVLTDDLKAEISHENQRLETAEPQEILRWAAERFGQKFTMATAFGPEGMILIHMLAEVAPQTPIFNLDTGYQFKETLELREEVKRRYGIEVEYKRAATSVEEYEQQNGGPVYRNNPDQCCLHRKVQVLEQAVVGMHAWASAIRRDQSPTGPLLPSSAGTRNSAS
jgi:phosphoadenosine phosphosulfate reductase